MDVDAVPLQARDGSSPQESCGWLDDPETELGHRRRRSPPSTMPASVRPVPSPIAGRAAGDGRAARPGSCLRWRVCGGPAATCRPGSLGDPEDVDCPLLVFRVTTTVDSTRSAERQHGRSNLPAPAAGLVGRRRRRIGDQEIPAPRSAPTAGGSGSPPGGRVPQATPTSTRAGQPTKGAPSRESAAPLQPPPHRPTNTASASGRGPAAARTTRRSRRQAPPRAASATPSRSTNGTPGARPGDSAALRARPPPRR